MTLNPRWTTHIRDEDRKKAFANTILNSRIVADRIRVIIKEELKAVERAEGAEKYDSPSWAYKQAHANGYYRAMMLFDQLFNFEYDPRKGQTNA